MGRSRAFDEDVALQKALNLFWLRGYAATSMLDLVAETSLHKASLYATFGNKHQLFMRALRHYQQQNYQVLSALTADTEASALEQIRQILELKIPSTGSFIVNSIVELAPHDADTRALARQYQEFVETLLTNLLTRGQQRGEVSRTVPAREQARLLLLVFSGMCVLAKADQGPQFQREIVQTALWVLV